MTKQNFFYIAGKNTLVRIFANSANDMQREETMMQTKTFLLTLGIGMVAGGAAALMLPQQSKVRRNAQKAVNKLECAMADMME